jgi:hypothetical protein
MLKLNHEIVNRVLRKAKMPCGSPNSEAREDDAAIVELCESWLQKWTLEWYEHSSTSDCKIYDLIEVGSADVYGNMSNIDGKICAVLSHNEVIEEFNSEAAARNWLAEQAAKDGYAIKEADPYKFLSWGEPKDETYKVPGEMQPLPYKKYELSSKTRVCATMSVYDNVTSVKYQFDHIGGFQQFNNETLAREFLANIAGLGGYSIINRLAVEQFFA